MGFESDASVMKFTTREIFGIVLVFLIGGVSMLVWKTYAALVLLPTLSVTFQMVAWISLLGTLFLLGTVVWCEGVIRMLAALALFLPSLYFTRTWSHVVVVIVSVLLTALCAWRVQQEIEGRLRFHFFRNVRSGSLFFVFAVALALSSAYFSSIKVASWEELVPRFSVGEGTAAVVFKTVAYVYPAWRNLAEQGVTVDSFLLGLAKKDTSVPESQASFNPSALPHGLTVPPAFMEYLKESALNRSHAGVDVGQAIFLETGREQIAQLVGRPVRGDEKMSVVFSSAIEHKLLVVLSRQDAPSHVSPTVVPLVLALLLFLTLLPLGSLLAFLWIIFAWLLFRLTLITGWLRIELVHREQEILADER